MIKSLIQNSFFFLLMSYLLVSCADAPDFSDVPNIRFQGFSKSTLNQGALNNDTIVLFLEFEDGDGDIGRMDNDTEADVFIIDNRLNDTLDRFKSPFVPLQGAANGILGTMSISIFTTCCIFPDGIPPCQAPPQFPTNDLSFDVFIVDRAGNQSNTITTESITLLCN